MKKNLTSAAESGTRRMSVIKWIGSENSSNARNNSSDEIVIEETSSSWTSDVSKRTQQNKYSCSFCKRPFKWRSHWKSHERIHTGERPYKCEICGKAFTRSDGLQCHRTIHAMNKYDSCLLRKNRSTADKDTGHNVEENVTSHETQSSLPQCRLCSKRCYSFAGMMKHMRKHKGKSFYNFNYHMRSESVHPSLDILKTRYWHG